MIPDYINCKTNEEPCDYIMLKECPNTCPYVLSLGLGACCDLGVIGRLEEEIRDETRDM